MTASEEYSKAIEKFEKELEKEVRIFQVVEYGGGWCNEVYGRYLVKATFKQMADYCKEMFVEGVDPYDVDSDGLNLEVYYPPVDEDGNEIDADSEEAEDQEALVEYGIAADPLDEDEAEKIEENEIKHDLTKEEDAQ